MHTAGRSWRAPVVVAAAGAWLGPLLAPPHGPGVPLPALTVTQQEAFHFAPRAAPTGRARAGASRAVRAPSGAPSAPWPVFISHGDTFIYGLPAGRDGEVPGAVKVADHGRGAVTTADRRDGQVTRAGREKIRAFVAGTLTDLDPDPVGELTCLYTSTATEDFVLDRHGPFVICSACSGHGAKFAPLTGELAADLACGGSAADPRFTLAAHGA